VVVVVVVVVVIIIIIIIIFRGGMYDIASSGRMSVDDEFGRMWKEAVVAYFKELCQHLPGRTTRVCAEVSGLSR
jgi:hypothetical protein